ncbi:helix-hairpin-helix domain-containing protein [Bacillaceae bacterium W0354]
MPIDKKWMVILLIPVIIILIIFLLRPRQEHSLVIEQPAELNNHVEVDETPSPPEEVKIMIDLKGEVLKPGVYDMQEGDRVIDVIERAGGFSDEADLNAVNLAQKLYDEMVIIVPNKSNDFHNQIQPINNDTSKVRVNTATKEQLMTLPGIGEQKALSIIEYREQNGYFQTKEDLLEISGIGEKTLERLSDYIIVP